MSDVWLPPCHTVDGGLGVNAQNGSGFDAFVNFEGDGVKCNRDECGASVKAKMSDIRFDEITGADTCARALARVCILRPVNQN